MSKNIDSGGKEAKGEEQAKKKKGAKISKMRIAKLKVGLKIPAGFEYFDPKYLQVYNLFDKLYIELHDIPEIKKNKWGLLLLFPEDTLDFID